MAIPEWNSFINADCMEYMKEFPDNYFDLAIIDPPYGGGKEFKRDQKKNSENFTDYKGVERDGRGWAKKYGYKIKSWDKAPDENFFKELFRVSKNQIIWGGNYFTLPPCRCFLIWQKPFPETFTMAMGEYAWTSFNSNSKIFKYAPQGKKGDERFHPAQKPIELYEWILGNYAKEGDTVLDTHVGSASSLIACRRSNHKYIGFEIDDEYYKLAKERLDKECAQLNIYDFLSEGKT